MSLKSMKNRLLALVYPNACIFCGKIINIAVPPDINKNNEAEAADASAFLDFGAASGQSNCCTDDSVKICNNCRHLLKTEVKSQLCFLCGESVSDNKGLCAGCSHRIPHIGRLGAMWEYEGAYKDSVINLKFHTKIENAETLGILASNCIKKMNLNDDIDIIIPVPLHISKRRDRGYNQAAFIADTAGKMLKIGVDKRSLKRIKKTLPQMNLDREQRKLNIKDSMKVVLPKNISGKNILLIDDIFTTGATLNECAKSLKEHGAAMVDCFTVCY